MGSIINIESNPNLWKVISHNSSLSLKQTGETIIHVCIGTGDYDYLGSDDICLYIRKSIYDMLMCGEYKVCRGRASLIIEDKKGDIIKPFLEDGQFIY